MKRSVTARAGSSCTVSLTVAGLPDAARGGVRLTHYRVDDAHSNAYAEWVRAGRSIAPDETLYARLQEAGRLAALGAPAVVDPARAVTFVLPRQGVSLLLFEWGAR